MFYPTSSLSYPGPYIITQSYIKPVMLRPLHQTCLALAPTYAPSYMWLLCSNPYIHACYAQAPTSCLLCSGRNICSILHVAIMLKPLHACLLCPGSYITPVMLRPQHLFYPTSSLLCPGPSIITSVLHQACNIQAPTACLLGSGSNMFHPISSL